MTVFIIHQYDGQQIIQHNLTLPMKMDYHFAGIVNDTFTVFGGRDGDNGYNTGSESISMYPQLNDNQWTHHNDILPINITDLRNAADSDVQIESKVYIINPLTSGGTATSYHVMFIYDLNLNSIAIGATPTYYADGTCVVYNGNNNIIYTIGGSDGLFSYLNYTQRYNVSSNKWIANGGYMKIARYAAGCCLDATNDNIFMFGGGNGILNYLDGIEVYDISNNVWSVINTTLSVPRGYLKCRLLSDGNIYCIGGVNGLLSLKRRDEVDVFDPISLQIVTTIHLNVARNRFSATLWNNNGCIIICGGWGDSGSSLDSIESIGVCSGLYTLFVCKMCSIYSDE